MTPQERSSLILDIAEAISQCPIRNGLTEEEIGYVRLAIKKESQSIKLRQAVIEKTLSGLLWAFIVFMGTVVYEYATNHGLK